MRADTGDVAPADGALFAALGDLQESLEELEVAEEELRAQNAELLSTRDALDNERRRYRALFSLAPDAYLTTDEHGLISEANEAAGAILGVESARLVGKPLALYVAPDDRTAFRRRLRAMRHCAVPELLEFGLEPRDAADRTIVEARVSPDGSVEGHRTPFLWILRDVSARKRAEAETRDVAQQLEQMVAVRTAELERTNDDLQRANAAKDEFLALVSHELKTPITMIAGFAELLRRNYPAIEEGDRTSALDDIWSSGQRLARIVENLLVVARAEHGTMIATEPVLLQRLLPVLLRELPPYEGHAIEIAVPADLPAVAADATYIERIVVNLLGNAAKYSPEGAPLELKAEAERARVRVTIADRGSGIRAEEAERIFSPFYRANATSAAPGMGLGLTVCRRLVEAIGGEISARPRAGGGSEFTFWLPAVDEALPA